MKDIRTHEELTAVTQDGQVIGSIVVRGTQIHSLGKIKRITGSLGLSESTLTDLGELEIIEGDFWTSNNIVALRLTSLGNLKHVSGDVTLRYSPIQSLGQLEEVGGRLSLRDTPITSLRPLKIVRGHLFLPVRFKQAKELNQIKVIGSIRFWKDSEEPRTVIQDSSSGEIITSNKLVPWDFDFEKNPLYPCCSQAYHKSEEIRNFYLFFRSSVLKGEQVFIDGYDNYAYTLVLEFKEGLTSQFNVSELRVHFENISLWYPITKRHLTDLFISQIKSESDFNHLEWAVCFFKPLVDEANSDLLINTFSYDKLQTLFQFSDEFRDSIAKKHIENLELNKDYTTAWQIRGDNKQFDLSTAKKYEKRLGCGIANGDVLLHILGEQCLTAFGQKHQEAILRVCTEQIHLIEDEKQEPYLHSVWWTSLYDLMKETIRAAENEVRSAVGVPKVGEGWVSETGLFYFLKDQFPKHKIQQHASPNWLGRQHLDIYFTEHNIAVEYQGAQHSKPIDFFGGEAAFRKNKERDQRKRKLCSENSCHLIYAYPEDDYDQIRQEVEKALGVC